jgi:alkylation response protein AidB-like acyl-CoA dehydrogenase
MSEPDSGSDAFALRTTAERRGDQYILNGTKTFVSNGPAADLFLIFATQDRAKGFLGLTGFLVERTTPGLKVSKEIDKMGLRTSPMAEVIMEDCAIPVENRIGREGRGGAVFNDSMEWERGCILASYLGSMERQLETCVRYAQERKQFGQAIGHFQSVANMMVDMKVRMETARLILYKAAWAKEHGTASQAGEIAAIAKLYLSDAWVKSCLDAVQVHGGYGFTTEYEVERDLRDSIGSRLYSGTSEVQRNLIARHLGL